MLYVLNVGRFHGPILSYYCKDNHYSLIFNIFRIITTLCHDKNT